MSVLDQIKNLLQQEHQMLDIDEITSIAIEHNKKISTLQELELEKKENLNCIETPIKNSETKQTSIDTVLSLKEFGLAFNKKIILSSITLDIPATGIMILMGPTGTGKSTLLKAINGLCLPNPAHRTWGEVTYAGSELFSSENFPALVSQNVKLMLASVLENIVDGLPERGNLTILQQKELAERLLLDSGLEHLCTQLSTPVSNLAISDMRQLAILRQTVSSPKLLCIDEPTAGLENEDSTRIVNYLKNEAKKRAILIVTHNKKLAQSLGGLTALIAGGWIQEVQETNKFFSSPISDPAKAFVETGSCAVPSPDARPEDVAPEFVDAIRPPPKEATDYTSHVLGPNNFLWLKNGQLAGTPRPGLLTDIEKDLEALKRVGITDLISLTIRPLDEKTCNEYGINVIKEPIIDMHPPEMEHAVKICKKVKELIAENRSVAIHCKAGLGRTGTLLASQLIFEGESAIAALEKVRSIEARWVQSTPQVNFLEEFEQYLKQSDKQLTTSHNKYDAAVIA